MLLAMRSVFPAALPVVGARRLGTVDEDKYA
jgi:hypothetical protein